MSFLNGSAEKLKEYEFDSIDMEVSEERLQVLKQAVKEAASEEALYCALAIIIRGEQPEDVKEAMVCCLLEGVFGRTLFSK